jgi:hypothetical protein
MTICFQKSIQPDTSRDCAFGGTMMATDFGAGFILIFIFLYSVVERSLSPERVRGQNGASARFVG